MIIFVADTNVLLYAADSDALEFKKCRPLLEGWLNQPTPWYLTWGILCEFLRVATHRNVFRKPLTLKNAWAFLEALLCSPNLRMLVETDRHQRICAELFKEMPELCGNMIFDAHTAILMREHGIRKIYTRDTDFHRFAFLDVIDPLR